MRAFFLTFFLVSNFIFVFGQDNTQDEKPSLVVGIVVDQMRYDLIAKYRYKIFGKKDECPMPSKDVQDRFLG